MVCPLDLSNVECRSGYVTLQIKSSAFSIKCLLLRDIHQFCLSRLLDPNSCSSQCHIYNSYLCCWKVAGIQGRVWRIKTIWWCTIQDITTRRHILMVFWTKEDCLSPISITLLHVHPTQVCGGALILHTQHRILIMAVSIFSRWIYKVMLKYRPSKPMSIRTMPVRLPSCM